MGLRPTKCYYLLFLLYFSSSSTPFLSLREGVNEINKAGHEVRLLFFLRHLVLIHNQTSPYRHGAVDV